MILETDVIRHASWLRGVQTAVSEGYSRQLMRCPVHLSVGQELLWSTIKQFSTYQLKVFSTHRGHLPYLTLDGDLRAYIAELHLHSDGVSGGNLGSMHIKSPNRGHITSVPIVGSSIPLAVGAAYAAMSFNHSWISIAHFGDGACEEGILHESLNLASVKDLPILFLCENNRYSCTTGISRRQPSDSMSRFAEAARIKNSCTSSSNLSDLFDQVGKAFSYISETKSPFFLEVECYRLLEHCGPSADRDLGDRTPQEYNAALSLDILSTNIDQVSYDIGYSESLELIDYYTSINLSRKSLGFK